MEGDRTETETQHLRKESKQRQKTNLYKRRANRDRNLVFFVEGEQTEIETHLHKKSEQRQKPNV